MCKITNQKLVQNSNLVGSIYNQILNENKENLQDAYNDACVWIAELKLQVDNMRKGISSGYIRTDTSKITWKSKSVVGPVDSGDDWIQTGAQDG